VFRRVQGLIVAIGIACCLTGCVERRFLIESNPPGAMVYVNNVPYGPTPVDIPFIYYGTYNVMLMKDGYHTKTVHQEVDAPWYQYPPIDFFSESLWPWQVTDSRPLMYDLEPIAPPNLDVIRSQADELRRRGQALPPPRFPELEKNRNAPSGNAGAGGTPLPPPPTGPSQPLPPPPANLPAFPPSPRAVP
jgi:hypothetical protein